MSRQLKDSMSCLMAIVEQRFAELTLNVASLLFGNIMPRLVIFGKWGKKGSHLNY